MRIIRLCRRMSIVSQDAFLEAKRRGSLRYFLEAMRPVGAARKLSTFPARKVSSWFVVSSVPCFRLWLMAGCRFLRFPQKRGGISYKE